MSVTACVTYERRVEKPRAASSVGVGRRISTPALRTARGFAYYAGTQMLFRVLPFVFPYGFLSKRETVRSLPPFGLSVMTDRVMPVLHVCHEVSGWPNKRAWGLIVDIYQSCAWIWTDKWLVIADPWQKWLKVAKVTKRVKIEKSKLFFVIPKTILVIPFPYNFLVSYPLSLKLFYELSVIPKTPNRASKALDFPKQRTRKSVCFVWEHTGL